MDLKFWSPIPHQDGPHHFRPTLLAFHRFYYLIIFEPILHLDLQPRLNYPSLKCLS